MVSQILCRQYVVSSGLLDDFPDETPGTGLGPRSRSPLPRSRAVAAAGIDGSPVDRDDIDHCPDDPAWQCSGATPLPPHLHVHELCAHWSRSCTYFAVDVQLWIVSESCFKIFLLAS